MKGNKMPVGLHTDTSELFTSIERTLNEGDVLFAFTDGLPDQFGGPKGKKFMYKQLESLFLEHSETGMSILHDKIVERFDAWKGMNEQVDDITVLGIKI
jgi:serine phosphatase RsbU (regulator of sigma subunit)